MPSRSPSSSSSSRHHHRESRQRGHRHRRERHHRDDHHRDDHHRQHDDHRRHRRRSTSSSSSSEDGGGGGAFAGAAASSVHLTRIGNEQDRERRLAEIEADSDFRPGAFVSNRSGGGSGPGATGGFAKLLSERGHDSAIFGRSAEAAAAAAFATAAAAAAAAVEAEAASAAPAGESGGDADTTEAARVRALMHPSLVKDLDKAWEDYRAKLVNLVRLKTATS